MHIYAYMRYTTLISSIYTRIYNTYIYTREYILLIRVVIIHACIYTTLISSYYTRVYIYMQRQKEVGALYMRRHYIYAAA